ncbi:MAG: sigma 54-interacting transcriptional regulator [Myxococcaceae bacterium]|nr:sigma 54-interacting transcriptional regulator [Myxococcaceae bacterium]
MAHAATITTHLAGPTPEAELRALAAVVRLADGTTLSADLGIAPILIGSGPDATLKVADPSVSRLHCELSLQEDGVALRDLGSKNGVVLGGVRLSQATLSLGSSVLLGTVRLSIEERGAPKRVALWPEPRFGGAVGMSLSMRVLFARLAQAAKSDSALLLWGESGTGKEVLARAVHAHSGRSAGPFVVLDVGGIARELIEAELFGYEKGAFTGATEAHRGLIAQAEGGTLFIDGVDEVPLEVQPRLLRALETGEVRPLGGGKVQAVHARVMATAKRQLRRAVADATFREDLYFRLAVLEERVPPLRERREDVPLLVEHFLQPRKLSDLPPGTLELLSSHHWPGNVRELRNAVSRLSVFPELDLQSLMLDQGLETGRSRLGPLGALPLKEAREKLLGDFERTYLAEHLARHHGNIAETARSIGVSRQSLYELLNNHGLRGSR